MQEMRRQVRTDVNCEYCLPLHQDLLLGDGDLLGPVDQVDS